MAGWEKSLIGPAITPRLVLEPLVERVVPTPELAPGGGELQHMLWLLSGDPRHLIDRFARNTQVFA